MMILYSGTACPFSHRCRIVLYEKGMDFEIRDVDLHDKPEEIAATILFLLSEESGWITGANIAINGGQHMY